MLSLRTQTALRGVVAPCYQHYQSVPQGATTPHNAVWGNAMIHSFPVRSGLHVYGFILQAWDNTIVPVMSML